jgi:predicted PurR-regulated permease PerM
MELLLYHKYIFENCKLEIVNYLYMLDLINAATNIITDILIPLAFALCLFYFFWGVAQYLRTGAGSEEAAQEAKGVMVWGIVGIFVAFSIWGIIKFIQNEVGIQPIENVNKQ